MSAWLPQSHVLSARQQLPAIDTSITQKHGALVQQLAVILTLCLEQSVSVLSNKD